MSMLYQSNTQYEDYDYDYEGEASQDPSQYTPTPQNSLNSRKRQEELPERSPAKRGSMYVVFIMILT